MGRICVWALRILIGTLLCGSFAHGQEIPVSKPAWRTDLRQAGLTWSGFVFSLSAHPRRTESLMSRESLAFGRGGHIVLAFLTQEIGGRGSSTLSVEASRKLHLISLDAATGRIVANRTWPAPGATTSDEYVGATNNGNFVVLNGNALCAYSPDLQEIDRVDLPADPVVSRSDWSFSVAPGGDVVFLRHYLNGGSTMRMLTTTPLREVRSWPQSEDLSSASEKCFAKLGRNNNLYVRAFDTPWHAIADLGHSRAVSGRVPTFINEDSLIVARRDSVQLINVDGQILFTAHAPKGSLVASAWGSPDGRLVAVAADRRTGITIQALDMYRHPSPWRILVYDTKSGSPVASLKFTWRHACAFSPDSSALAVLSGGIIELFSLPQPNR